MYYLKKVFFYSMKVVLPMGFDSKMYYTITANRNNLVYLQLIA